MDLAVRYYNGSIAANTHSGVTGSQYNCALVASNTALTIAPPNTF